jgi:glycosyltransferase involved in cell wall biosynthesis
MISNPSADIVLPVYNGLAYAKDRVESLLECTSNSCHQLYLIDDFSDLTTQRGGVRS